jgi:hypothetical protein
MRFHATFMPPTVPVLTPDSPTLENWPAAVGDSSVDCVSCIKQGAADDLVTAVPDSYARYLDLRGVAALLMNALQAL